MASESGLVGYVALSLADLQAFNDGGELRPDVFCAPGVKGKYVPLDPTMESAIETAVTQWFSASFLVAECDTKWYLVKLSFSNVTIASMFQAKELSWGVNMIRLRLWTSVNAKWFWKKCPDSLPKAELIEVPLSQMSMEDWGDRVLHWKLQVRASCQQCSQADRSVWKATGGGHYCAECWHAHGKRKVCGSLHELEQMKLQKRWPKDDACQSASYAHTASESGLVGYVALSLADLQAFNDGGELRPDVFCAPGVKGKYVPLDPTMESAIETAVTQWFSASFLVAECDTKWYLVKLSFSNVTIASMFQAKELSWGVNMIRLRLWTSVNAKWFWKKCPDSLPKAELIEVPLSQMSMEDWGDRVLHWKLQVRASCQQCSQADRSVWKATGGGHYCAECWHAHGKRKVCGSLHELEQMKLQKRWPKDDAGLAKEVQEPSSGDVGAGREASEKGDPPELTFERLQIGRGPQ